MGNILCHNTDCKYNSSSKFCQNDFIVLTRFAQCNIWYNNQGQYRGGPVYPESAPVDAMEQQPPPSPHEKMEEKSENEQETVNAETSEKDEKREEN